MCFFHQAASTTDITNRSIRFILNSTAETINRIVPEELTRNWNLSMLSMEYVKLLCLTTFPASYFKSPLLLLETSVDCFPRFFQETPTHSALLTKLLRQVFNQGFLCMT